MASSGGEQELGRGYNCYLKVFWGFSFETLHFFENYRPPWDVIKGTQSAAAHAH